MHCGMKLILTSDIDFLFFFQIATIDDSIDNDPNYVEATLDIEEDDDGYGDDDDDDEVNQDDDFDDHEHDLDDDVGGAS